MQEYDPHAEALEWTRATVTIDEVRDRLESDFDLVLKRESVRSLLADIGAVAPIKMGSPETGRGRVSYYDPLVCWLAYAAFKASQRIADRNMVAAKPVPEMKSSRDVRLNVLAGALDDHRDAARKAVWGKLATAPKKRTEYNQLAWDWRVESVAYHLFISDLEYGLEPRELNRLLVRRPRLLNLTLDGNWHLENVLRVYVSRYMWEYARIAVNPKDVNLFGDVRKPISGRKIDALDTLSVLDQFDVLQVGGSRLSEPDHVDIDAIDPYSEGDQ